MTRNEQFDDDSLDAEEDVLGDDDGDDLADDELSEDGATVGGGADEDISDPDADASKLSRTIIVKRNPQMRLDLYLQERLRGISRSRIQKLINNGGVTIDGVQRKSSYIVQQGDHIHVTLPRPAVKTIEPEDIPLDILYEDEHFVVVNKQANLIIHPARSHSGGTLVNALAYHFKKQLEAQGESWATWETRGFFQHGSKPKKREKARRKAEREATEQGNSESSSSKRKAKQGAVPGLSSVGAGDLRPGIVHRLDRDTTGCIVVAKSDFAHWRIARQFEKRVPTKAYLAVVHGNFDHTGDVIDLPLGKHPTIHEAYAVRHDHLSKASVTIYRVREQYKGYSLVELELKTGRTHQIRVHLSYLGHPIVGDVLYGGEPVGIRELDSPPLAAAHRSYLTYARPKEEGQKIDAASARRDDMIMPYPSLHAGFLRFIHPATEKPITFTAPVHSPMRELLIELRKRPLANAPVATEGTWTDLKALIPEP